MSLKRRAQSASTTETPAVEAPATPPPAAEAPRLTGRKIDPALLRAAMAAAQAAQTTKTPFLKLSANDSRIRLLGPKDPAVFPLPYLKYRFHKFQKGKYENEALDFDFLFSDPALTQLAIKAGKVTQADYQKWQRYQADPWSHAGSVQQGLGITGEVAKEMKAPYLFPNTKFAYNVIDRKDGKIYLFCAGKEMHEKFEGFYSGPEDERFDIYDEESGHDILIKANGESGLKRRYTSVMAAPKPSPAGEVNEAQMTDLQAFVVGRAIGWDAKVHALFNTHGEWVRNKLKLTPESFGVASGNVPAAAVGGDE
jgi:hypothetical protein